MRFGDFRLEGPPDLYWALSHYATGDTVTLEVIRGATRLHLSCKLAKQPTSDDAMQLLVRRRLPEAVALYRELLELEPTATDLLYNYACAEALLAATHPEGGARQAGITRALDALRRCTRAGWIDRTHATADPDLAILRDTPGWRALMERWPPIREAERLLRTRQYPEALAMFERLVAFAPGSTDAWLGLARAASRASVAKGATPEPKLLARARTALRRVVELSDQFLSAVATDPDLAPLRAQPGWEELLRR